MDKKDQRNIDGASPDPKTLYRQNGINRAKHGILPKQDEQSKRNYDLEMANELGSRLFDEIQRNRDNLTYQRSRRSMEAGNDWMETMSKQEERMENRNQNNNQNRSRLEVGNDFNRDLNNRQNRNNNNQDFQRNNRLELGNDLLRNRNDDERNRNQERNNRNNNRLEQSNDLDRNRQDRSRQNQNK